MKPSAAKDTFKSLCNSAYNRHVISITIPILSSSFVLSAYLLLLIVQIIKMSV